MLFRSWTCLADAVFRVAGDHGWLDGDGCHHRLAISVAVWLLASVSLPPGTQALGRMTGSIGAVGNGSRIPFANIVASSGKNPEDEPARLIYLGK